MIHWASIKALWYLEFLAILENIHIGSELPKVLFKVLFWALLLVKALFFALLLVKALFFRTFLGTFKSPHTFIRTIFCTFFCTFLVALFWALFCGFCLLFIVLFWALLIASTLFFIKEKQQIWPSNCFRCAKIVRSVLVPTYKYRWWHYPLVG